MIQFLKTLLNRRELAAFVVSLVIMAAAKAAEAAKLPVPAAEIDFTINVAIANVAMALMEGTFKPSAYGDAWRALWQSKKFHLVLISLGAVVVNEFVLVPFGVVIPEEVLTPIGYFLIGLVTLKGGVDTVQAVLPRLRA